MQKELTDFANFSQLDIRAGTVLSASPNEKAKNPAYKLHIDFGELGIKQSSAQLCENYQPSDLVNKQIIAIVNFPSMKVAGFQSEVLVLAVVGEDTGTVLLTTDTPVKNGQSVA